MEWSMSGQRPAWGQPKGRCEEMQSKSGTFFSQTNPACVRTSCTIYITYHISGIKSTHSPTYDTGTDTGADKMGWGFFFVCWYKDNRIDLPHRRPLRPNPRSLAPATNTGAPSLRARPPKGALVLRRHSGCWRRGGADYWSDTALGLPTR